MKVKVGDKVYSSADQPVMVILTAEDKYNIQHMAPEATRYAEARCMDWTPEEMLEWMMDDGSDEDS